MDEQKPYSSQRGFYLAGIVPIAKQPFEYKYPFDDCLMPIGINYMAIQKAIVECACAGCDTIWIVCHRNMQPLIKKYIGTKTVDPKSLFVRGLLPSRVRKNIQIYYKIRKAGLDSNRLFEELLKG